MTQRRCTIQCPNYLAGIEGGLRGLRVGIDAAWNASAARRDDAAVDGRRADDVVRGLGAEIRRDQLPGRGSRLSRTGSRSAASRRLSRTRARIHPARPNMDRHCPG